jgi:phosphatidylserine/phosphatidylglycerophosphate/cardiolipin synthase-like enzyme
MSFNLVPKYYPTGRDFGVIDSDAADVGAMEATFDGDWAAVGGGGAGAGIAGNAPASGSAGDDLVWSPGSRNALVQTIAAASSSLDVYNEEMADDGLITALEDAARRGVTVRVVMTYSADWKRAFDELAAAGVEVRTYPDTASGLYIHAKMILADGRLAFVGSENFSATSLDDNRELGVMLSNPAIVASLGAIFEKDRVGAEPFRG